MMTTPTDNEIEQTGYTLAWAEFARRLGYTVILFALCWLTLWVLQPSHEARAAETGGNVVCVRVEK